MSNGVTILNKPAVTIVRFDRPELRNPISEAVLFDLSAMLDRLVLDGAKRPVIFTGSDVCFASGAYLREVAALGTNEARSFAHRGQNLMNRIERYKFGTFAAINGICFGGGLDLALACDIRVASPNAVFSHPGANIGIMTGWGGTQRLPRLIGRGRALEMLFTAARFDAHTAFEFGLIDEIVNDPLERAVELAAWKGIREQRQSI